MLCSEVIFECNDADSGRSIIAVPTMEENGVDPRTSWRGLCILLRSLKGNSAASALSRYVPTMVDSDVELTVIIRGSRVAQAYRPP